jgi:hypothetical protein
VRCHHLLRAGSIPGLWKGGINKDALGQGSRATYRRWTNLGTSPAAVVLGYDTARGFLFGGGRGTVLSRMKT